MSFLGKETSNHSSEPIETYTFIRGATTYRYTSSDEDVVLGPETFLSITMGRGDLELSGEVGRAPLTVTVPRDLPICNDYVISPPSDITTLVVKRGHRGELPETYVVVWMGRVLNFTWIDSSMEFMCEPVYTSIKRLGLRRQFSRGCTHVLYGSQCRVNATAHKYTDVIAGLTSNTCSVLGVGGSGDNYYSGGYVQWDYQGRKEKKMILKQIGDVLTLSGLPLGASLGATAEVFPGCDHTMSTCKNKFSNLLNFGGCPWIPTKNPFGSIPLW